MFARGWKSLSFSVALFCAVSFCAPLPAAEGQADARLFTAAGIHVDVTDTSAAAARRRAMENAQNLGFFKVLERILLSEYFENLPQLSEHDISYMVEDISVRSEKTSRVRYIGTVDVRFYPEKVKSFLKTQNIPFVFAPSSPQLLIPSYRPASSAAPALWEGENPWMQAWQDNFRDNALVPLVVPSGEEKDRQYVTKEALSALDPAEMLEWQNLYGVSGILVAEVLVQKNALRLRVRKFEEGRELESYDLQVPKSGSLQETFKAAMALLITTEEQAYRNKNVVDASEDSAIVALVPIESGIKDWLQVKERLSKISRITRFELKAITKDKAQVNIYFVQSVDSLIRLLAQQDLLLQRIGEDVWQLSMIPEAVPRAAEPLSPNSKGPPGMDADPYIPPDSSPVPLGVPDQP